MSESVKEKPTPAAWRATYKGMTIRFPGRDDRWVIARETARTEFQKSFIETVSQDAIVLVWEGASG